MNDAAVAGARGAEAAAELQAHRSMLFGVAYRLLGTASDTEDVLQDAYLRWRNVPRAEIREPRRYLTRMVTRLAIDRLRARSGHEVYTGPWLPEPVPTGAGARELLDPLESAEQRDSVATATLYLMERLDPVERAVFVLRAAFDVPYGEIAEIVQCAPEHCRQLRRRASERLVDERRRFEPSRREHARLLDRFLVAARDGDLSALRNQLHSDVVTWSDGGGRARSALNPIVGVAKVSRFFAAIYGWRRVVTVTPVELNGSPGAVIYSDGWRQAMTFAVNDERIGGIFLVSNPDKLGHVPF